MMVDYQSEKSLKLQITGKNPSLNPRRRNRAQIFPRRRKPVRSRQQLPSIRKRLSTAPLLVLGLPPMQMGLPNLASRNDRLENLQPARFTPRYPMVPPQI